MWHPVIQNTDEPCPCCGKTWMELRGGKVTGSSIGKVMAHLDKKLKNGEPKFGDPALHLATEIAIVELGGMPTENNFTNSHMQRGHEQEIMSRKAYEGRTFCNVTNGGFYDNGRTGCSPDGRMLPGCIEIKSVINHVQEETINRDNIDPKYKWQVIFNLKESGLDWIDYISFCNTYYEQDRLFVVRLYRDNLVDTFGIIDKRLSEFFKVVDAKKAAMVKRISMP